MSFWGNRADNSADPWCLTTPQVGLANPMRWSPDMVRDEDDLPPWSWLVAGPGNEAPQ